jgi:hypothetical protein
MSRASEQPGLNKVRLAGVVAGLALLGWCWYNPSIHILWQAPVGLWLLVTSLGKIAAR